jgi:hypothetical protein
VVRRTVRTKGGGPALVMGTVVLRGSPYPPSVRGSCLVHAAFCAVMARSSQLPKLFPRPEGPHVY